MFKKKKYIYINGEKTVSMKALIILFCSNTNQTSFLLQINQSDENNYLYYSLRHKDCLLLKVSICERAGLHSHL